MLANHKYFHWLYHTQNKNHLINWSSGLFIWLFLAITRPFGINNNNFEAYFYLVANLMVFGGIWVSISYLTDLFAAAKPRETPKVDLIFWLIKLIVFIHMIFLVRQMVCDWACFDTLEYLELWVACVIMLGIPYVIFSLYGRYLFFHSLVGKSDPEPGLVRINGEGKEKILIAEKYLVYIKSDDNYVDFETNNGLRETMRATLSSVEYQLKSIPGFIRIHRSYIVNMKFAEDMPKKDTLRVRLKDQLLELPISRKYQPTVSEIFNHPK
ncbi:LytR/AlgR family response regulator transcription factor [Ekhidna sp.]|uniref:LytR/AlgR family response regulator transcription factor n=1 Tax=Ekhidna sp. TaxID=2608089 RepID=UPI003CCB8171